jgi:CTP:molybdopterin cytidylyltransferase MocA
MGTLKQLLPWGNRTVIEASVDAACRAPEVDRVVVVLGHEADKIKAVLEETHRPKLSITEKGRG